eukprot:NODE_59_length_25653_cov_0.289622.p4 type:complete len:477 gc:universal NODE_59_length_25653_cov_0.289622:10197-8767(-)
MNRKAQFNVNAQEILPAQPTFEYYTRTVSTISFHPSGNLLAVGSEKGPIGLWELEIMDTRHLVYHFGKVTGLEWIHGNLWSSSTDFCIIEWCIEVSLPIRIFRFDAPIYSLRKNPTDHTLLLVQYSFTDYVLITTSGGFNIFSIPALQKSCEAALKPDFTVVISWSYDGNSLIFGDSSGLLNIFNISTLEGSNHSLSGTKGTILVSDIECSKSFIMVNASDGILRLLDHDLNELHTFQDIVNKYKWTSCTFSNDCEYIIASGDRFNASQISIFESSSCRLLKTLNSYNVGIQKLVYHPCYPTLAVITVEGGLTLHALMPNFSWGAFEPRFKENEENEEFSEDIGLLTKAEHYCVTPDCDCFEDIYMNRNLPGHVAHKPVFPGHEYKVQEENVINSKSNVVEDIVDVDENDDIKSPLIQQVKIKINLPENKDLQGFVECYTNLVNYSVCNNSYPILPPLPSTIKSGIEQINKILLDQ